VTAVIAGVGFSKRFSGLTAVDSVDLQVAQGEIRGIVGPNGAGKTTLFNLFSGLYPVSAGRVLFRGVDVTRRAAHLRAAAGLGRTYQTPQVFYDLTLFDNVAIGLATQRRPTALEAAFGRRAHRGAARQEVEEVLAFLRLPLDLALTAGALSFAQQKRLEIARALAGRPAVLLLDEPAAGLNRAEIEALGNLIAAIRDRGVTVCLVEHNMRLVMNLCDRISVLDFGRKIAEGKPDEVRRNPLVVKAYLGKSDDAPL
jgi:branched-chain amino acid transport system ATP-binding protein